MTENKRDITWAGGGLSRRDFLRLGAASGIGLGISGLGWLGVPSVSAEPRNVGGMLVDDLPLLGPYLLPTETPFETVRIAFRGTDDKTIAAGGVLRFGKKAVGEREIKFAADAKHVVDLPGLAPDSEYQYQLDLGDYQSPRCRFRTAPLPGTRAKSLKVALLFDIHAMEAERLKLANPASKPMFFRHCASMVADLDKFAPDILLLGGDNIDGKMADPDSVRGQYEMLFRIMRGLFSNALVVPCPGNHEWGFGDPDLAVYGDYFPLPQNGPDDDKNNTWSFACGGIGFQFRADDPPRSCKNRFPRLRKSAAPWIGENLKRLREKGGADVIIDAQHFPIFHWGDGKGGATPTPVVFDPQGQPGVTDAFDACGDVRIALAGHTHMHQRTYPLLCEGGVKATTSEKTDYGPDTRGTIHLQCPSLWRGYPNPVDNALVAKNGRPSFAVDVHGYAGYGEMTITPQDIVTETFLYDKFGKVSHEKVDSFRVARRPAGG